MLIAIIVVGAVTGALLVADQPSRAAAATAPTLANPERSVGGSLEQKLQAAAAPLTKASTKLAAELVTKAKAMDAVPQSGLHANYAGARAFDDGNIQIVSVPLQGADLPEVSHLTFITAGGETKVTEMAAEMIDAQRVHFSLWEAGRQTKNVELVKSGVSATAESSTLGFSMDKLKNCLNNAGINWALIAIVGVACSVACATAVLCAPCIALNAGLTGGTISKCVKIAFG